MQMFFFMVLSRKEIIRDHEMALFQIFKSEIHVLNGLKFGS